jgi:hypothetical protein
LLIRHATGTPRELLRPLAHARDVTRWLAISIPHGYIKAYQVGRGCSLREAGPLPACGHPPPEGRGLGRAVVADGNVTDGNVASTRNRAGVSGNFGAKEYVPLVPRSLQGEGVAPHHINDCPWFPSPCKGEGSGEGVPARTCLGNGTRRQTDAHPSWDGRAREARKRDDAWRLNVGARESHSQFEADPTGFEPAVSGVTGRRVRPLHYGSRPPIKRLRRHVRLYHSRRASVNTQPLVSRASASTSSACGPSTRSSPRRKV